MPGTVYLQEQIKHFVEELASSTDQARSSPELLDYLAFAARFHHYSMHNTILIFLQRPSATHVAGFHTWKSVGRYVRKGEKGIAILAPIVVRISKQNLEDTERRVVGFRTVYVFDVTQTEGEDLPAVPVLSGTDCESNLTSALLVFASEQRIAVVTEALPSSTYGLSQGGRVVVDEKLTGADHFAVLVHEIAHELLDHHDQRKEVKRKQREIEAEAVAHVVCCHFHIPSTAANYLALNGADSAEVMSRLDNIVRTIQSIISGIESHLSSNSQVVNA